jgi:glycosyltransferase involved in cell wall biosynthesis
MSRPLVVTRVGSLEEVVEEGVSGRVVPPEDRDTLAEAIVEILNPDRLPAYTEAAAQRGKQFSWGNLARVVAGE